MNTRIATAMAALLVAGLAGSQPAHAQGATTLQNEQLMLQMPSGTWKPVSQRRDNAITMIEYVPEGQTGEKWDAMITVQIFHGLTTGLEQYMALFKQSYESRQPCEESTFDVARRGTTLGIDRALGIMICTKNKQSGQGELAMIQAMRGKDAMYVVQRAWRGAAYTTDKIPLETDVARDWIGFLERAWVCDTREAARPCPTAPGAAPK